MFVLRVIVFRYCKCEYSSLRVIGNLGLYEEEIEGFEELLFSEVL